MGLTLSPSLKNVRLFLIEPHVLLANALCSIASSDDAIAIVGESRSLDERALAVADPDLVMVDCDADLQSIPEVLGRCRRSVPNARICVLSEHSMPELMTRALKAGADGYIVKDVTPEELLSCIKRICKDGFYVDERLSLHVLRNSVQGGLTALSPRELDVLRLVAQGLSNQEIGEQLKLSNHTIKNHIANIFSKLHLTTRTQLAIYALRGGWI